MLIVDMPMPNNCEQCPLAERVYSDCENFKLYCLAGEERKEIITLGIPVWCPIVGVLPEEHGDLIDRDEMYDAINSRVALIDSCPEGRPSMKELFERAVLCTCLHDVVCVNAVVAAERKDDEDN